VSLKLRAAAMEQAVMEQAVMEQTVMTQAVTESAVHGHRLDLAQQVRTTIETNDNSDQLG
jgi:hypothetical protein